MIGAATWLLGKFGLSLADGKSLMPLAAFVAACVAAVGLLVYIAHHLTAAGYDKAAAECHAATAAAREAKHEAETQLQEASREVIIRHATDAATLAATGPARHQEITDYANANPAAAMCRLDADGLRLWNRDPLVAGRDPALLVRRAAARTVSREPPAGNGGIVGRPAAEPRGLEGAIRGPVSQAPGPVRAGGQLHELAAAGRSSIGFRFPVGASPPTGPARATP